MKKILLLALVFRLLLSFGPYHPDLGNHLDWGIKFWEIGPHKFYENLFWQVSWPNQPPGTMYLFAGLQKVYEGIFSVIWWLNLKIPAFPSGLVPFLEDKLYVSLVKLPSIFSDLGIAFLIYRFLKEFKNKKIGTLAAGIFLFNPVIWYNSSVWGQTDAIINFLVLLSFYFLWRKKIFPGVFFFFLSLYFKGSLLIFLPVFLIFFWKSEPVWWKRVVYLISQPVIFAYLSWPFVRWMSPLPWMYHLYRDRIFGHQGNMLTANAFNLWAFIFGVDFSRDDLGVFLSLTYKKWGMITVGLFVIPVFLRLVIKKIDLGTIFASLAIIAFSCFVFMTNMHERYLYPVFPYLTILIFVFSSLKWFYWVLSGIFLLNLYHLWFVPNSSILPLVYTPFSVKLFSLVNIGLFFYLFCFFFRNFRPKKV